MKKNYKNTTRLIFYLLMLGFIVFSLIYSKNNLYSRYKYYREIRKHPYYSEVLDISKQDSIFKCKISENVWQIKNKLDNSLGELSIVFDNKSVDNIPGKRYYNMKLELEVDAYAVVSSKYYHFKANRLVKNYSYPTDRPMSEISKKTPYYSIYDSYIKELGLVNIFDNEDLYIVIKILEPDPLLNKTNPKLRLIGYSPLDLGPGYMIGILLFNILFYISLLFIVILGINEIRRYNKLKG
jgi:hypothetical protein